MSEDKVRVKINIGNFAVEVECHPNQLKETIEALIKSLEDMKVAYQERGRQYALTCKEAIENLWKEGWFVKARKLSEVWEELSRRGYNYDRSAVSHALNALVKDGALTRLGKARKYQYVQKTPAQLPFKSAEH
ncbi:MAG: hypothetical protein QXH96_00780 [Candidatus Geothermarchaeota archaeon]